jgi:hypothetical protein
MLELAYKEKKQKVLKVEKWWKKSKLIEKLILSNSGGAVMNIDTHIEVTFYLRNVISV